MQVVKVISNRGGVLKVRKVKFLRLLLRYRKSEKLMLQNEGL